MNHAHPTPRPLCAPRGLIAAALLVFLLPGLCLATGAPMAVQPAPQTTISAAHAHGEAHCVPHDCCGEPAQVKHRVRLDSDAAAVALLPGVALPSQRGLSAQACDLFQARAVHGPPSDLFAPLVC